MIILNDQHAHPAATAQKSNLYKVEVVFRTWQLFQFRVSNVQFSDLHLQLFNEAPYTFLFSFSVCVSSSWAAQTGSSR